MGVTENLKRGVTELVLLGLLTQQDMYGYEMAQALRDRSSGKFVLLETSMYPTLYRLQDHHYISSYEELVGRRRKRTYYHIENGLLSKNSGRIPDRTGGYPGHLKKLHGERKPRMKIPAQQNGNPLAACYCSQLDKALSEVNYAKPLKRQFLSQMQDSLCNYLEAHPDARLEDLYAAFGTPQEAADSALLNTDSAQIKKQLKTSQLFHFLFAVVIAILVMVVVYRLGALAINRYVSQPYIIESPATVITGPLPTDTP